jgi:shikimate dehydrogenase
VSVAPLHRIDDAIRRAVLAGASTELGAVAPRVAERRIVAGLIGRGIQASRTPRMHEAEGARLGLRYIYKLIDFDCLGLADQALPDIISAAGRHGFSGVNVTHPFKESIIAFLDELSPDAASIGAVNTVVIRDGKSVGHNTDCWGFAESFRRSMSGAGLDRVVLIGAGGAGLALSRALLDLGVARLTIFDLDRARAAALTTSLASTFGAMRVEETYDLAASVAKATGLINATPMGMAKYPGMPIAQDWLRPDLWVADIVYFPVVTELLREARAAGCRTLPGTGMAIFQAVKAFELITGVKPDAEHVARHFDED